MKPYFFLLCIPLLIPIIKKSRSASSSQSEGGPDPCARETARLMNYFGNHTGPPTGLSRFTISHFSAFDTPAYFQLISRVRFALILSLNNRWKECNMSAMKKETVLLVLIHG
jgi:hypothetical protein